MSAGQKIWKTTGRVLLCGALLAWIFHIIFLKEGKLTVVQQGGDWNSLSRWQQWQSAWQYGPPELWRELTTISFVPFFGSLVLMGIMLAGGVFRWQRVLNVHGLNLTWGRATEISLVAHFFNSFLLGSTGGDLMKAFYAARETRQKKTEAVVTVFADRLIGLWAMLLFAGLMMLPNLRLLLANEQLRALAFFILAMFGACTGMVALAFWGGVSRGWSGARHWLRRLPRGEWLERLLNSCRQFGREPLFFTRTLAVSMVINTICVLQFWLLSWGLKLDVSPVALFLIVPMIVCISAIPITPSGLGVRESIFVLIAPVINTNATSALSLSLLAYAGSLFWSLVGGGVYLTFKERHHLKETELDRDVTREA